MGIAREMGERSMALTEAKDRDGWLALFADDGMVQDPVGPSIFDEGGNGHRGKEAITAFYDNVISASESLKFDIRQSADCGRECAFAGSLRITLPGGQQGTVELVNIYKVNDDGKIASLRSFWEFDKLSFS
jgi:hypothetical protein